LPTCSLPIATPRPRIKERFQLCSQTSEVKTKARVKIIIIHNSRRRGINSSRERSDKVSKSYSERGIFETEPGEVTDGRNITDAAAIGPSHASCDIDSLLERPCGDLDRREGGMST
jgi:hypothetical protein